jgi:hypothetical protein
MDDGSPSEEVVRERDPAHAQLPGRRGLRPERVRRDRHTPGREGRRADRDRGRRPCRHLRPGRAALGPGSEKGDTGWCRRGQPMFASVTPNGADNTTCPLCGGYKWFDGDLEFAESSWEFECRAVRFQKATQAPHEPRVGSRRHRVPASSLLQETVAAICYKRLARKMALWHFEALSVPALAFSSSVI